MMLKMNVIKINEKNKNDYDQKRKKHTLYTSGNTVANQKTLEPT